MERNELAAKLELIGRMFAIDGMSELLEKFEAGMSNLKFSAIVIQVESLLMQKDQDVADKIIAMNRGIEEDEVAKLDDAEYAAALRAAILTDVIGFFGSSPRSAGKK